MKGQRGSRHMLTKNEILQELAENMEEIEKYGVRRIGLFQLELACYPRILSP
jgi:hypothetical protein